MIPLLASLGIVLTGGIPSAQAIEIIHPEKFTPDEVRVIQKIGDAFAVELDALKPLPLRIEKIKSTDPKSSDYTRFDGRKQRVTISISRAVTDINVFASTVCHELGHVLGGSGPVTADLPDAQAMREGIPTYTNIEGQADYFAAMKCIPRLADVLPPVEPHSLCQGAVDEARCSLVMTIGKIAINAMVDRRNQQARKDGIRGQLPRELDYGDRSNYRLPLTTYSGYSDDACRLQTWKAAALCDVDSWVDFSPTDEDQGACVDGAGMRPRCWYLRGSTPLTSPNGPRS